MQINNLIHSYHSTVNDIVTKMNETTFFVDDTFQRRLVWTERQKVRLIESLLTNYPIPEIYLWARPTEVETGRQTFSIVDGQQRMTTIQQYVANEFPIKSAYLDTVNATKDFAGKYWRDLSDEDKRTIWDYKFNVRRIPNEIDHDKIRIIFRRLNETDRSLNPQELRHAEFNGEFIKAAKHIADLEFWRKWQIFRQSQIRRMGDIEFASSMLIFLNLGIVTDDSESINHIYNTYNDQYESKASDIEDVKGFLGYYDSLLEHHPELKFFNKTVHLYTLFAVMNILRISGYDLDDGIPKLKEFVASYTANEPNPLLLAYREGAASRTRSKSSRERRVDSLMEWINPTQATLA